jgi:hypothetical protein
VLGAALLAVVSAHDYAGSWNDGSRLATVESLADFGTLAIDDSIFVHVLSEGRPYGGNELFLLESGTLDKLYIHGHFYSDKSPAPALAMAGVYKAWQGATGIAARLEPERFCTVMTFVFSGLAYVVAVWCVFQFGRPLNLPMRLRLVLTASFALATVALTYSRHVNNHILLLGVAAPLFLQLAWFSVEVEEGRARWLRLVLIGLLTGFAYTIDLGTGPVLVVCVGATLAWRLLANRQPERPALACLLVFAIAALPGICTHHIMNYMVGGTFKPANANPEYFLWSGCPFTPENMTGNMKHSPGSFLLYAGSMLFGKRGFIGHDLPLFLALPAMVALLWKRGKELPEILCAGFWCGGTWLAYALTSNNSSGLCCSIRWFVPLLAPAYYVLTVFLRRWPEYLGDLLVLSGWGAVLSALMWHQGPWITHMVPLFWPIQAAALFSWLAYRHWYARHLAMVQQVPGIDEERAVAA